MEVGIYQQFDQNDRKHTVITVTATERAYKELYGKIFDFDDKVGFEGTESTTITFKGRTAVNKLPPPMGSRTL